VRGGRWRGKGEERVLVVKVESMGCIAEQQRRRHVAVMVMMMRGWLQTAVS
jgi:hypothetical protein